MSEMNLWLHAVFLGNFYFLALVFTGASAYCSVRDCSPCLESREKKCMELF